MEWADEMVAACEASGSLFVGGALCRALPRLQEVAGWLRSGQFGTVIGASVHGWSSEILGAGNQHTSVLRLLTDAEVETVTAWCDPPMGLRDAEGRAVDAVDGIETDTGAREPLGRDGAHYNAIFTLTSGIVVPVFGHPKNDFQVSPELVADDNPMGRVPIEHAGVRVWTSQDVLVYSPGPECQQPPQLFKGFDAEGAWLPFEPEWQPNPFASVGISDSAYLEMDQLGGSIRSMLNALENPGATLAVSGHDLRQALEVSTAAHHSASKGSAPVRLPLADRVGNPLYPRPYRWVGGDAVGSVQDPDDARAGVNYRPLLTPAREIQERQRKLGSKL